MLDMYDSSDLLCKVGVEHEEEGLGKYSYKFFKFRHEYRTLEMETEFFEDGEMVRNIKVEKVE